jgi:hypothetical protein
MFDSYFWYACIILGNYRSHNLPSATWIAAGARLAMLAETPM